MGLGVVLFLIAVNGFFVSGEFALVAVDRQRVETLAEEGHAGGRSILTGLKSLSFQLSGAQLGITVSSLILGFVVEDTLGAALRPPLELVGLPEGSLPGLSLTLALIVATGMQMVLGELFPKNLAIARPLGMALWVVTPLRICNAVWRPLVTFLNSAANWTVRLVGIEPHEELVGVRTLEEIELLVEASYRQGTLRAEEAHLLARSIAFREKVADEALVPRTSIVALQEDATLEELARIALESGHSRFPVFGRDLDDITGVVHVKNSYRVPTERRASTTIAEVKDEPLVVPESRSLDSVLLEMRREHRQMAIVIDEYGGTAGLITLEDLLEEIVGEIEDEYDLSKQPLPILTSSPEGVHVLSGMLNPDEVKEQTGLDIPEGDYETLAGFLLSLYDRIPEPGAHTYYDGWEFKVVEMERRRIAKVLVVAPPPPAEEGSKR